MPAPEDTQHLYEQLAVQCQRRQEPLQRDVFLVLAADSALALGRADQAERLRRQLLDVSPSTMLRPYASFAEALDSSDIREYVVDLRQQYPPEMAAQLLETGGNGSLFPADLFDESTEPGVIFPVLDTASFSFADPLSGLEAAPKRTVPPPALHVPARSSSVDMPALAPVLEPAAAPVSNPPPAAPVKPRRRSPYEDPDYGPRVPANAKPAQDFLGIWVINLLVGLVGLLVAGLFAWVFVRPFLAR